MGARATAMMDGLRLRCPACREGRMSPRWWSFTRVHARCPGCDLPFIPGQGDEGGGVEAATTVSVLLGFVGVLVLLAIAAPLWAVALCAGLCAVVLPFATYRHFRGAWVGTMYGFQAWAVEGDPPRASAPAWPWDD